MYTIPIPSDTITFTYTFAIYDDDLFEIDEMFKVEVIESSLHEHINREEPYKARITIANNDGRK